MGAFPGGALRALACLGLGAAAPALAQPSAPTVLPTVEVTAAPADQLGVADAASEGAVTARELAPRPSLRPADVLELVPGVIVTQHSGAGKANQYFLRGFNLDHGTDFLTTVLGMPVNMPTHAHGQGYTDLAFLIPELVRRIDYRKGPYFADQGDFSSAGAAHIDYFRRVPQALFSLEAGEDGYRRALAIGSPALGNGHLLYALEGNLDDGPWEVPQDLRKLNGVLGYSRGTRADGWAVTAMGYRAKWTATDQVAQRALDAGLIGRFGSLDPTDGGESHRYSLSGQWARSGAAGAARANAYFIDYRLDLFSNFTYFLDDAVNGDQFEQADRRRVMGGAVAHTWYGHIAGAPSDTTAGLEMRYDRIRSVGLFLTRARQRLTTVREDTVDQSSIGPYVENRTRWTDWLRTYAGVRGERYDFDVASDRPENSGRQSATKLFPKLGAVLGPWQRTELYANYGEGFHSNDARGVLTRINPDPRDPGFLGPVAPVTPLARTRGYEGGVRSVIVPGLEATVALWRLNLDSELLFVGDAGTTEPSRPSRRQGIEAYLYYSPAKWLSLDLLAAYTHARFRDDDPAGDRIPGAIETAYAGGLTVYLVNRWFGSLRFRYFGARPLVEDNSVRSPSSMVWNLRTGYELRKRARVILDVINLFDRKTSDIDYFYESRLSGEPAPVADIHTHPAVPRTVRVALQLLL
jgi:hypothetical protein